MFNVKCIGISGKWQSGKDTVARMLQDSIKNHPSTTIPNSEYIVVMRSFASCLKRMLHYLRPQVELAMMETETGKNSLLPTTAGAEGVYYASMEHHIVTAGEYLLQSTDTKSPALVGGVDLMLMKETRGNLEAARIIMGSIIMAALDPATVSQIVHEKNLVLPDQVSTIAETRLSMLTDKSITQKVEDVIWNSLAHLLPTIGSVEKLQTRMILAIKKFEEMVANGEIKTVGQALQRLGTDCIRNIVSDQFWIALQQLDLAYRPKNSHVVYIYTDVRFPNEYDFIRQQFGEMIRIKRKVDYSKSTRDPTHVSETALDTHVFDHIINNDGSLSDTREQVDRFTNELFKTLMTKQTL